MHKSIIVIFLFLLILLLGRFTVSAVQARQNVLTEAFDGKNEKEEDETKYDDDDDLRTDNNNNDGRETDDANEIPTKDESVNLDPSDYDSETADSSRESIPKKIVESRFPEIIAIGTSMAASSEKVLADSPVLQFRIFEWLGDVGSRFHKFISVLFGAMGERVRRKNVLENKRRNKMYEFVLSHPGSHFRDILRATNASPNEAMWHLQMLEKAGLLKSTRFSRYLIYHPNGYAAMDQKWNWTARFALRQDKNFRIASYLAKNPGAKVEEMAQLLSVHPNTVRYHIDCLKQLNLIQKINAESGTRFFLTAEASIFLQTLEHESSNPSFCSVKSEGERKK